MKREFLQNVKAGDQPMPKAVFFQCADVITDTARYGFAVSRVNAVEQVIKNLPIPNDLSTARKIGRWISHKTYLSTCRNCFRPIDKRLYQ